MKTNVYKKDISDTRKPTSGITKNQINSELLSNAYPALYIESDKEIVFDNSTVIVDGSAQTISGKTVIEVVKILRDLNVDAYITRRSIGMMPAELLIDFKNQIIISEEIDVSPKDTTEIHHSNLMNVPGLEEASIDREIVSVYSKNRDIEYTSRNTEYSFYPEGDLLYINGLVDDTMVVLKYNINKFFIFMKDENFIEINKLLQYKDLNINNRIMLNNINSNNWDKI